MRKIKEYKVVWNDNAAAFEKMVNEKLAEGWDLYGCVHCYGGRWHQAVVKYVSSRLDTNVHL